MGQGMMLLKMNGPNTTRRLNIKVITKESEDKKQGHDLRRRLLRHIMQHILKALFKVLLHELLEALVRRSMMQVLLIAVISKL